ncbi:MAG TPA: MFS transporter [Longilinea sp.]|nr:MFS transporter [Longilinea sp.]
MPTQRPEGMRAFTVIWAGQVFSLIGSAMSAFALTIWAWETQGTATALALVGFFNFTPMILFSPIAGALVDRWNRKVVMALSDLATGVTTVVILVLFLLGKLQLWHLFVTGAFAGIFQSFQWPAYSAAISLMMPKKHYGRASGMISLAQWGSGIFAPVLAGMFIGRIGLGGILTIDLVTLAIALGTLAVVVVPQPVRDPLEKQTSLFEDAGFGFRYIFKRPSLLWLQLVFFAGNLIAVIAGTLVNPMVLAWTGNNAATLGTVQSAGAIGGVAGSLLLTAWGGPKKRIHGVLLGWILCGLLGYALFGLAGGLTLWLVASFLENFIVPILNGSNQVIWQTKVPPAIQGRVFSVRLMIAQITAPISMLVVGPLADKIFEPGMQNGGMLMAVFGGFFGNHAGSGMALMITVCGILMALVGTVGYLLRRVRNVELLIPDHDAAVESLNIT